MKTSLLMLVLLAGCGKISRVQEGVMNIGVGNDLRMVEVRVGALYRDTGGGYDYLDYEGTRYRVGTLKGSTDDSFTKLPTGQEIEVYFKGTFARRSGVSVDAPAQVFDVVDLEMVARK